jgi:hypothetical protein
LVRHHPKILTTDGNSLRKFDLKFRYLSLGRPANSSEKDVNWLCARASLRGWDISRVYRSTCGDGRPFDFILDELNDFQRNSSDPLMA